MMLDIWEPTQLEFKYGIVIVELVRIKNPQDDKITRVLNSPFVL
ncbi:MAG: hypothetical protein WCF03_07415 [Nitrososphaeraceae archaeon]|jgi:hypothetical protein